MVDVQPHYFGGLIDRVDLVIDHHPEQPGYTAVFKDIRADYGSTSHDPHRAPARRRREHLGAHRDGDALRDQVRHAVLQPPDQPRRPRGVLVSLSAGRRRADPQDGRRRNHARAARLRDQGAPAAARSSDQVFCAFLGAVAARGLHPLRRRLLPAARGRQVDGHRRHRQRLAGRSRCATSATRRTPASSCGGSSPTSAAPAAIARWPRRSCRCARSARSSASCRQERSAPSCRNSPTNSSQHDASAKSEGKSQKLELEVKK